MARRHKNNKNRSRRRTRGAGYGFDFSSPIVAGSLPVVAYSGPGKDCADIPSSPVLHQGVPGLKGFVGGSRNRNRTRGGRYGFDGTSGLMSAPFVRLGCAMRGGSVTMNPAYYASTAGYSNRMDTSSGTPMMYQVGYPEKDFNSACLQTRGGSRRSKKSKKSKKSRKH
jgi:hypothetical protein